MVGCVEKKEKKTHLCWWIHQHPIRVRFWPFFKAGAIKSEAWCWWKESLLKIRKDFFFFLNWLRPLAHSTICVCLISRIIYCIICHFVFHYSLVHMCLWTIRICSNGELFQPMASQSSIRSYWQPFPITYCIYVLLQRCIKSLEWHFT